MIEHTEEDVRRTRALFLRRDYPLREASIAKREIQYFVLPQELNEDLPDFVFRVTRTGFPEYVMGVSASVPADLQPYFILSEWIEFMELGLGIEGRVVQAEKKVLEIIPEPLRRNYLERRVRLFTAELKLDQDQPEKYALGDDGRVEFKKNLAYLSSELDLMS